jgi:hypothetical protein
VLARALRQPEPLYLTWGIRRAVAAVAALREGGAGYRPRHPEAILLHRLLEEHLEEYLACHEERFAPHDGPLGPHVRRVMEQVLECGRLQNGFARIRCGDCGAERLLALACQA